MRQESFGEMTKEEYGELWDKGTARRQSAKGYLATVSQESTNSTKYVVIKTSHFILKKSPFCYYNKVLIQLSHYS